MSNGYVKTVSNDCCKVEGRTKSPPSVSIRKRSGNIDGTYGPDPARGDRLSRLSEACLRINESLGMSMALQETLGSTRALAEANCGDIILLDKDG